MSEQGEYENEIMVESDDSSAAMSLNDEERARRRYNRHTPQQIEELENFFKECPNPDEMQRSELAKKIGLENKQIKFWFQNKRTQKKVKHDRNENVMLRQENDRLMRINRSLKEAMKFPACSVCQRPTNPPLDLHQLCRFQNPRINLDLDPNFQAPHGLLSRPIVPSVNPVPQPLTSPMMFNPEQERSMYVELAIAATNELTNLGQPNYSFWRRTPTFEYNSVFNVCNGVKPPGYVAEASKETGLVLMNSLALVDILMNTNRWVNMFAAIVSMASFTDVISPASGKSGSLQLIEAEFQVISPLVPRRTVRFLRYCKQHSDSIWTVVDVSCDLQSQNIQSYCGSKRFPSGVIIEDMPNGHSKVTWIEQTEYDESHIHTLYQPLIRSGIGLGATRWLATLQRQSESYLTLLSLNPTEIHPGLSSTGLNNILQLAQRMTLNYVSGITTSSLRKWETLQVDNVSKDITFMTRKNKDEPGELTGIVLGATTSVWLPVSQSRLFNFLSDRNCRNQWDILSLGTTIDDVIRVSIAQRHDNNISLFRVVGNDMLVLQDTWNDASGALVVYAPVETQSMEDVINGRGDSSSIGILSSGFSILPDGGSKEDRSWVRHVNNSGGECLMTIGFQILVTNQPTGNVTMESVKNVENMISQTIKDIKSGLNINT